MTFKDWEDNHNKKVNKILDKIKGYSEEEIIEYFDFDNMVLHEPEFCPLYETNTKCHNIKNLSCLFCGCPYFKKSDDKPFYTREDGVKIMSSCQIGAKNASVFIHEGVGQCDCTNCTVPHNESFVKKYFHSDGILNSLERVREYQIKGRLEWKE